MRAQKRKVRVPVIGDLPATWCDEVAGDILELWIGISRLMARVHGPDRPFETGTEAAGQKISCGPARAPSQSGVSVERGGQSVRFRRTRI